MLSQRYKEEVILIASEMNTFVRSLDSTIHSLRQQLAEPLSEPVRLINHYLFISLLITFVAFRYLHLLWRRDL